MSTIVQEAPPAVVAEEFPSAPALIRRTPFLSRDAQAGGRLAMLPAWIASAALHCLLLLGFWFVVSSNLSPAAADTTADESIQTSIDRKPNGEEEDGDITNTDEGIKPKILNNTGSLRQAPVTIQGPTDPLAVLGNRGILPLPAEGVAPLPPGYDRQKGPVAYGEPATGPGVRTDLEGSDFRYTPGGFEGRSGATRQQLVTSGGGNKESELAVARALEWFSLHQSRDGSWSLDGFDEHAHDASGKEYHCSCGDTGIHNNIAATSFALLPFLGAGLTPTGKGGEMHNYTKTIDSGLKYLMRMQKEDGAFVVRKEDRRSQTFMYAHCLATITLCEAASLSSTPDIRESAQRALDFLCRAQHQAGGWRYRVKQDGDMSVTGWAIMALQSGRLAGLVVPRDVLDKSSTFLDSVQYDDAGAYGYRHRPSGENDIAKDPSMTAAGLLCRQYLGWGPNNQGLLKGVARLRKLAPESDKPMNIYYYYYATQVMHHIGGASWREWNSKMLPLLLARQDKGLRNSHQRGSWSPTGDPWGIAGGRVMMTSLACLTLEVYYRHLPLYQELGGKQ